MPSTPQVLATDNDLLLQAALGEYHALYKLAEFRLTALDRRIPIIGGLLTAFLSSVPILPAPSQILALIAVPISLVWLLRTTINHARSFEDALRAIERLEHMINSIIGQDVMGFQSTHPSKGNAVGGRTGKETVWAVVLATSVLILFCLMMGAQQFLEQRGYFAAFCSFLALITSNIWISVRRWKVYRA